MENATRILAAIVMAGALSLGAHAQTSSAARYDNQIQQQVTKQFHNSKQFNNVQSSVEDGIVTLTGKVDLYREKLDAAKKARRIHNVQGVRNLLEVASTVPDQKLQSELSRKIYYGRVGWYDNPFDFVTVSVKNGVVTVGGETYDDVGRDSAFATIANTPGVKDVVDEVKVAPTSLFDDNLRLRTARAIYGDSTLGRYGTDPAMPIRIIVNNGNIRLYGTVENTMDKQIAGIRASSVPGAFSVQNYLTVEGQEANSGM